MKKRFLLTVFTLISLFVLGGCGKTKAPLSNQETENTEVIQASSEVSNRDELEQSEYEESESEETEEILDYVIVKMPEISKDSFGNGLYEEYNIGGGNVLQMFGDESLLLTDVLINGTSEAGEAIAARVHITYEKSDDMVTQCQVNIDGNIVYATHVFVLEEVWNKPVGEDVTYTILFDEPVEQEPYLVSGNILNYLFDNAKTEEEQELAETMVFLMETYFNDDYVCNSNSSGANLKTCDLDGSYFFQYGGVSMGEDKITNDPGWTIDMGVSHDEVYCKIEVEKDENGNITLVHRYNDYAIYDRVYTYDAGNRLVRCDVYEYPKGQNRESVGTKYHMEYYYDIAGRVIKAMELGDKDSGVNVIVEYTYDESGRLIQQTKDIEYFGDWSYTMQQTYERLVQTYTYDEAGMVGKVTLEVFYGQNGKDVFEYVPAK